MIVRFHHDPDTGLPHVLNHGVTPIEALEVLRGHSIHGPGRDATRIAEGQTRSGRYLRVIFKEEEDEFDGFVLIITAYDLKGKAKAAYRRRRQK